MKIKGFLVAVISVGLVACAATEVDPDHEGLPFKVLGPASKQLNETERFAPHAVGTVRSFIDKEGGVTSSVVEHVDGSMVQSKTDSGCQRLRDIDVLYWPQSKWWNCAGPESENEIEIKSGEVWPMEEDNIWTVTWSGSNTEGRYWQNAASCLVKDEQRVSTPAGEFDAYKVVCDYQSSDRKNRFQQVRYFAPEAGYLIAARNSRNGRLTSAVALKEIVAP